MQMMKMTIFYIISAFLVFHVGSDSISELKTVVSEAVELILNYEEQFSHSRIQILNDLKDTSTNASGEAWKATIYLVDILALEAETKEKKDCIASGRSKLSEIIKKATFSFDNCIRNSSAIGDSIRKKIQESHMASLKIQMDLEQVEKACSRKTDEPGKSKCISLKVDELKSSLQDTLTETTAYNIEAGTIKPIILSDAMNCNLKVLTGVFNSVTILQKMVKDCV